MDRIITVFFHKRLSDETIRMLMEKYNLKILDKNPDNPWVFTVEYPMELDLDIIKSIFNEDPNCYQIKE